MNRRLCRIATSDHRLATSGDDGGAMNNHALFLAGQGRQVEAVVMMFERAIAVG
jgi:Tfp pilus assembly protein PilF